MYSRELITSKCITKQLTKLIKTSLQLTFVEEFTEECPEGCKMKHPGSFVPVNDS